MTCIVGLTENGKLIMGSDSILVTRGWECTQLSHPKVFRSGEMLIGVSGKLRLLQIVEHLFKPDEIEPEEDGFLYLVRKFVPALRYALSKEAFLESSESGTDQMDGNLLIGLCGKLYIITLDFAVEESVNGYEAIGSGTAPALGSLFSTGHMDIITRARYALLAAAKFDAAVRGPFTIIESSGEVHEF